MNLHWIDWTIVVVFVCFLLFIAVRTQRVVKSVAGFLAAQRCAGRYLITMAEAMAYISAVGMIGNFQNYYRS